MDAHRAGGVRSELAPADEYLSEARARRTAVLAAAKGFRGPGGLNAQAPLLTGLRTGTPTATEGWLWIGELTRLSGRTRERATNGRRDSVQAARV